MRKKIALLSVFDKTGLSEFALALKKRGFSLITSSGTANFLKKLRVDVIEISDYTGSEEILDGRLKTLHSKIYAGILAKKGHSKHLTEIDARDISYIDLIAVNFYDFSKEIKKPNCTLSQAIEKIDIGGPAMARAAAKNHGSEIDDGVSVIVDPSDYSIVLDHMDRDGKIPYSLRLKLAKKAYFKTAEYDGEIASYLRSQEKESSELNDLPKSFFLNVKRKQSLRYGENPHQRAAIYLDNFSSANSRSFINYHQIQGKELSFNNITDADAAWECVNSFTEAACVIVKHANPCGVAIGISPLKAYQKAFKTDPMSAFGGTVAFNFLVTSELIKEIINNQFVETIVAPDYEDGTSLVLEKKKNIRVLKIPIKTNDNDQDPLSIRQIGGGLLIQDANIINFPQNSMKIVTKRKPTSEEFRDLNFAWNVVKYVKSNGVVFARNGMTLGIGTGQMSRIDSIRIASMKANDSSLSLKNSVLASDAFFPFQDALDFSISAGVTCIIHPGGGIHDNEIISSADSKNISMVLTGIRCFRH